MSVSVYVNADTSDSPLGTSGVDWVELNLVTDYLIFSNGSDVVIDGAVIPTPSELSQAGVLITTSDVEVPKFFLADLSANQLKQIHNMGNQNKRYVFAFDFSTATASEPILELWDDTGLDSIDNFSLGQGTASNSWFRGIATTAGAPGAGWTGSRLAGSSEGNFLWLNNQNGALTGATTLYCNIRITVPASFGAASSEQPIFSIKFTTN